MPKFLENAKNKTKPTNGEFYGPATEIKGQTEADEYFEEMVKFLMKEKGYTWTEQNRREVEKMLRSNLGYYAGYYDNETRERVERLFKCAHPVFGSIAEKGEPTPEQAFEMGKAMGERAKRASQGGP